MNKKAFTLVELLATIVIITLIGGIGTVAYTNLIQKSSDDAFKRYRDAMHAEAIYYVTNNYNDNSKLNFVNGKATISFNQLQMDPIINPKDKSDKCEGSYVEVTKSYTASGVLSMNYKVCLLCNDFEKDNPAARCKEYEN